MQTKRPRAASEWVDPDDAPHLTREWFERADLLPRRQGVRRGRPKSASPKEAVNLRLDADVLKYFRKTQENRWAIFPREKGETSTSGDLSVCPEAY